MTTKRSIEFGKRLMKAKLPRLWWKLRGGHGYDFPCKNPRTVECALSKCQYRAQCMLYEAQER